MTEKDIFKRLKAITSKTNECEFVDNNCKYKLEITLGNYSCDYTISTRIKPVKNAKHTIAIINNSNTMNKYGLENDILSLSTRSWIDKKPTIKSMEEIIKMSVAELSCIKSILEEGTKNE